MKKWFLLTTILATVVLAFNACNKDDDEPKDPSVNNPVDSINNQVMEGVFKLERKIHKIYYAMDSVQELDQTWIWDNNTLKRIEYPNNSYSEFEYSNKQQIVKISSYSYGTLEGYVAITYKTIYSINSNVSRTVYLLLIPNLRAIMTTKYPKLKRLT